MSRFYFALCLLALIIALSVYAESLGDTIHDINDANPHKDHARVVAKIIRRRFHYESASCINEAGEYCKENYNDTSLIIVCAIKFFDDNKERCRK